MCMPNVRLIDGVCLFAVYQLALRWWHILASRFAEECSESVQSSKNVPKGKEGVACIGGSLRKCFLQAPRGHVRFLKIMLSEEDGASTLRDMRLYKYPIDVAHLGLSFCVVPSFGWFNQKANQPF